MSQPAPAASVSASNGVGGRRVSTVALAPRGLAAIAGAVSAIVALALGELIAGLIVGVPSPIAAVGAGVIDFAPPGSKDFMVSLFGTNDKTALTVVVVAAVLLVGVLVGLIARRQPAIAIAVILGIVGVGLLASLRLAGSATMLVLVSTAIQAGAAVYVLNALMASAVAAGRRTRDAAGATAGVATSRSAGRRSFLIRAGILGGLAIVGGGLGRRMLEGRAAQATAAAIEIPAAVDSVAPPGPDASFDIAGLTPVVVPNADFYRIDTALITPAVDLAGWSLRVFGMVDHEVTMTFDDLMQLPLIERYVTIACVSNEVGGDLVGNAKWTGVRLSDVLDMAGVQPGATQVVPRSVDGWTAGFPTAWVTDPAHPRDAMIAVKMNDQPLPAEHGFPARLIVPGLYGYVSATKWLAELELTTLEAFDAYWVPRGWAKKAPILTQSRIDVPNGNVQAGIVPVAGVAWAPDRGISKVEIQVDGGEWQPATLATEIGPQTWVQWKWSWQAAPGNHVLAVRATDGTGETQTAQASPPPPDGARGYHQIAVQVG
jgi:DMSO/TMAO reductase YedYZ molybdopterin-dependent catalytic subunit